MKHHLNTLYVLTQKAWLAKKQETLLVRVDKETRLRLPLAGLDGIVCFGNVTCSPFLLGSCEEHGIAVTFLTRSGRFLARLHTLDNGNVLLRRTQFRQADDPVKSAEIVKCILLGKLLNSRTIILRHLRDYPDAPGAGERQRAADDLRALLDRIGASTDLDTLRGFEGDGARIYFSVFDYLINADLFVFEKRSRRPPLNAVNALLSLLYTMLSHDCTAALASVGLDPQVGFLHRDRPGRPGLALDLMEELRPVVADRLVLSLINRAQIKPEGFVTDAAGAVRMDDDTRRVVLNAYQKRKQEPIHHPFLNEKITFGLIPYLQARLLAKHLRGDLDGYPPFVWK